MTTPATCCVALMAPLLAGVASAQVQTGHYIPGWNGSLKAGMMAEEPGLYFASTTFAFRSTSFRDGDGNIVPDVDDTDYILTELAFVFRPDFQLFGADYQAVIAPSIGNLSGRPVLVDGELTSAPFGISDLFFSPLTLGWHFDDLHVVGCLGGFAPTGTFDLGSSDNTGTGFWTFMPYVACTYRLDSGAFEDLPLLAMGALRYEINTEQDGHDFRPGDALTLEYGIGLELGEGTHIGLTGFWYQQVTDATGDDVQPTDKYRSFGLGGEFSHSIGPVGLSVRIYQDFEVRNGPEGLSVFLGIEWTF